MSRAPDRENRSATPAAIALAPLPRPRPLDRPVPFALTFGATRRGVMVRFLGLARVGVCTPSCAGEIRYASATLRSHTARAKWRAGLGLGLVLVLAWPDVTVRGLKLAYDGRGRARAGAASTSPRAMGPGSRLLGQSTTGPRLRVRPARPTWPRVRAVFFFPGWLLKSTGAGRRPSPSRRARSRRRACPGARGPSSPTAGR